MSKYFNIEDLSDEPIHIVIGRTRDGEVYHLEKDLQTAIDICNNRQKEIVRLNDIINKALCSIASCDWNDKYVVETYDILKGSEE